MFLAHEIAIPLAWFTMILGLLNVARGGDPGFTQLGVFIHRVSLAISNPSVPTIPTCIVIGNSSSFTVRHGTREPTLGGATTLMVEQVLEVCLNATQTVIVPAFEKFINNP